MGYTAVYLDGTGARCDRCGALVDLQWVVTHDAFHGRVGS